MRYPVIRPLSLVLTLATAFLLGGSGSLFAVIRDKADNTTPLNQAASWSGGVPGIGDVGRWTSVVTAANGTVALGADLSWRGLAITNPNTAINITGNNTLTLANNGIDMSTATANLTISSRLALFGGVGQIWNVNTGTTLSLDTLSFTRLPGATVNIQGAGSVLTSTITNNAEGIIGTWMTTGTGAAARYSTVSGGAIVGLTGTAAATAANVTSTSGTVNYDVAAVGTLGPGASVNTLRYTGTSGGTIAGALTVNGLLNASSTTGGLIYSGPITIGANRELVVTNGDASRSTTLTGSISNNASGTSGVTKAGDGVLTLSGSNSYTGITYASRGTITAGNNNGLGSTLGGTWIHSGDNSSVPTTLGGVLNIASGMTVAESIVIANGSGNPFASLTTSGAATITGTLYLTGAGIRTSVSGLTVSGGVVANNTQYVFNGTGTTISGTPWDLGSLGNFYSDSGIGSTITIATSGNLWADSMMSSTVRTMVSNALPTTTNVRIGVSYQPTGAFDLNGTNQTVASIRSDTFIVGNRSVTSATAATLTVNQSGNFTTDVRLTGAVSLVKTGTGTLSYVGSSSTTTGSITVARGIFAQGFTYASTVSAGGTLALADNISAATPMVLAGGNYQLIGRSNGTATTLSNATWGSGTNAITVASTAGLTAGQPISGGTGLPAGAFVVAVTGPTTFIINANTTAAQAATSLTVGAQTAYTSSQTFNSFTLAAGGSSILVNRNGGDGTVLNLGTITKNTGGTVVFTLPDNPQTATNGITISNTNVNSILGGWATIGNDWAINSTNGANGNIAAYTGYTDVTRQISGTKTLASDPTLNYRITEGSGGTPADITPNAGGTTDINTLLQSATGGTVTYNPGTTDILRLGAEGGILVGSAASALNIGASANDGILTAGGQDNTAGTIHLTNNHTTNLLTINSTIANNGSGIVTLVKSGAGTAVLTGTNTYTGKTYLSGGRLSIASEAALGVVSGGGATDQLTFAGGTLLVTATMSLDDANRGVFLATAGGTFETNGGVTLTVANVISGSGDLTKTGTGILTLAGANTYTGETIISGGTLALGNVNALQNSTLVAGGSLTFTAAGTNTYNIGSLRSSGNIAIGANSLSVGANNLAHTYSGVISGTGGFTKTGTAVLNISGANTYSGDTLLNDGYLGLYNINAVQNSTLDTGAASNTKAVLFNPTISTYNLGGLKGSDDLDINVNSISVGSNNQSTTFSGAIISAFEGNVTKVGTGTLTYAGANTYGGATNVNVGTLQVGQAGVGQTGFGAVTVATNAQLIGTGTVQGLSFTLNTNATLRPGDTVANSSHGTLTFTPVGVGTYTLSSVSNTILSLSSATNQGSIDASFGGNQVGTAGYGTYVTTTGVGVGSHDRLVFNGVLGSTLLVDGNIQIVADSFTAQLGQIFNLVDWASVITPTMASAFTVTGQRDGLADNGTQFDLPDLNTLVSGLYWDTTYFASNGIIVVVPEPSRALLILLAAGFTLLRRRRR